MLARVRGRGARRPVRRLSDRSLLPRYPTGRHETRSSATAHPPHGKQGKKTVHERSRELRCDRCGITLASSSTASICRSQSTAHQRGFRNVIWAHTRKRSQAYPESGDSSSAAVSVARARVRGTQQSPADAPPLRFGNKRRPSAWFVRVRERETLQ